MSITIDFVLNGRREITEVDENLRLLDLLREKYKLFGSKEACGQGECGACTVLMNKEAVLSCLILAAQIDGADIVTIEGLEKDGQLDPIQTAFIEKGAIQCGYCTPGMIMSAKALLLRNSNPSDDEIKEALAGNLCRCTGYTKILEAVKLAVERGTKC